MAALVIAASAGPPAAGARTAPGPTFRELTRGQQQRFGDRVEHTPAPLRRLVHRAYPHLRVRLSHTLLGGEGDHTATLIGAGPMRFVVALTHRTLRRGAFGRHMTLHELGHVVANGFFRLGDWNAAFKLFSSSPAWRYCFPTPPGSFDDCVGADEILAEQIAFMGSPRWFRTSYKVPPLASQAAMAALLRGVG